MRKRWGTGGACVAIRCAVDPVGRYKQLGWPITNGPLFFFVKALAARRSSAGWLTMMKNRGVLQGAGTRWPLEGTAKALVSIKAGFPRHRSPAAALRSVSVPKMREPEGLMGTRLRATSSAKRSAPLFRAVIRRTRRILGAPWKVLRRITAVREGGIEWVVGRCNGSEAGRWLTGTRRRAWLVPQNAQSRPLVDYRFWSGPEECEARTCSELHLVEVSRPAKPVPVFPSSPFCPSSPSPLQRTRLTYLVLHPRTLPLVAITSLGEMSNMDGTSLLGTSSFHAGMGGGLRRCGEQGAPSASI